MILGFGNNVVSALAGDITTIQTDIPVMPGTGAKFAKLLSADFENKSNGQRVYAKITLTDNKESAFEICHLVSVSGDVLKVIRGQEGTTAKGWSLNDVVANFATRGSENYFVQIAQLQSGHYIAGVTGGTANALTLELPSTFFVNGGTDWTLRTPIIVFPVQNNTNAATLQLTLGGKVLGTFPLYKGNKSELVANDIIKGIPLICLLDSEKSYFSVINPGNIYSDFDLRYVKKSGDLMTGELKIRGVNALRIFNEAFGLIFRRSEECLHLIPTSEGQGENGDIGPLRPFAINLRTGAISVSHGAKIDGGLALGTDNALGGNSITLGDNDTGIKQGGDGVLLFYSNGQLAFGLQPASADFYKRVAYIHQGITPDGSGAFADQLNNATAPFVQTRFAWNPAPGGHYVPIVKGLSVRNGQGYPGAVSFGYLLTEQQGFPVPCIHMRGDNGNEALWQFNPNDKSFFSPGPVIAGGATLASNGDINGAAWGGWLSAYLRNNTGVQDVRYGSEMFYNPGGNQVSWIFRSPSGHGLSGINVQETGSNSADNIGGVYYRPLQKLINGTWYNVASV
ncbi:phage tail protein [Escherichia coli]|nr:phage tail protein [Escherichia coli]MCT6340658.1 phage tail protein [Escherichia coli]MDI1108113.1 phage tail protein [Escherichia coli]